MSTKKTPLVLSTFLTLSSLFTLTSLTSCSMALQDHYSSVTPHSMAPISEGTDMVSVENYYELVNALLFFVTEHREVGVIRLLNLEKEEVKTHLTQAVAEVLTQTALGSYGVDSINWESTAILGNYEAEITITYKKTEEDFENILSLNGEYAITRTLTQEIVAMNDHLVVQNSYASSDRNQISTIVSQAFAYAAQSIVEIPQVHITFYPKEGPWRLVEFQFEYSLGESVRRSRQQSLERRITDSTGKLWTSDVAQDMFQLLAGIIWDTADLTDTGSTAYDVLVLRRGNSRGFAFSIQALCQEMDLSTTVVEGSLDGITHYWNQITLPTNEIYHIDVTLGPTEEGNYPYYSDYELEELGYVWNRAAVMATTPLSQET